MKTHPVRPLRAAGVLTLLLSLSAPAAAQVVTSAVDLAIVTSGPDASSFDITISAAGATDSATTSVSGTLETSLQIDLGLLGGAGGGPAEITQLEFTGGQFALSDATFDLNLLLFPVADISSQGIGGQISTLPGGGAVTTTGTAAASATGGFPAADHPVTLNTGIFDISSPAGSSMIDLSTDPQVLPPAGTPTIELTEAGGSGVQRDYDVRLVFPINSSIAADAGIVTATVDVAGSLVAVGTASVTVAPLLLTIDPASGAARIENISTEAVEFDGYTIASDGGQGDSLRTTFRSLEDQGVGSWNEANLSAGRLSELHPFGEQLLEPGGELILAGVYDPARPADLTFAFTGPTGELIDGFVEYAAIDLTGDFNADGTVDGADYALWRNNLGGPGATLQNRPEGSSGVVGEADLAAWQANFGKTTVAPSAGAVAAAPEPAAACCLAVLLGVVAGWSRRGVRVTG